MRPSDDPRVDFIEAVVELRRQEAASIVTDWCIAHDLTCSPMTSGLLVSGLRARFEEAFGKAVPDLTGTTPLEPPPELQELVGSVIVLPVPHLHEGGITPYG